MRKAILMLTVMALGLALASGVALAATVVGTSGPDTRSGTASADEMYGLGGHDVL